MEFLLEQRTVKGDNEEHESRSMWMERQLKFFLGAWGCCEPAERDAAIF